MPKRPVPVPLNGAQRRQLLVALERLREIHGSDRKIAEAIGVNNATISRITLESGASVDLKNRLMQLLANTDAEKHVGRLLEGERRLRDLADFDGALEEARHIGPPYPDSVWDQVGDQLAAKGQETATVWNCLNAAQFVASGVGNPPGAKLLPPASTRKQR